MSLLDALAKDQNSVPSTHIRQHTTACHSSSVHPPLAPVGIYVHMCAHTHTLMKMRDRETSIHLLPDCGGDIARASCAQQSPQSGVAPSKHQPKQTLPPYLLLSSILLKFLDR